MSRRRLTGREAIAQSLRELEKLFGKKPPDTNEIAAGKSGEVGTQESTLPVHDSSKNGGAQ
jgi:hypothetical protein